PSRVNATCVECIDRSRHHQARSQRSLSTIRRAIRDESPASSRDESPASSRDESPASSRNESPASSRVILGTHSNSLTCHPAYPVACGRDCVVSGHTASINSINRVADRLHIYYPLIYPDIYAHLLSSGQEFTRHSRHGLGG